MVVCLGGVVGFIVVALFMPLVSLIESVQGSRAGRCGSGPRANVKKFHAAQSRRKDQKQ